MIHVSVITNADPADYPGAHQWKLSGRPEGLLFRFETVAEAQSFRINGQFPTDKMFLSTVLPRSVVQTNGMVVPSGMYKLNNVQINVPPDGYDFISVQARGTVSVAQLKKAPAQLTSLSSGSLWGAVIK